MARAPPEQARLTMGKAPATNMNDPRTQLDPEIQSLLARLRRLIRLYVWTEGIAALVALVGLAFWIGLALDWLFEPPPAVRVAGLVALAVAVLVVAYRFILARTFVRLSDSNMALLLERHAGRFDDSLLTAVELREGEAYDAEMLSHTRAQARAKLPEARLSNVFNPRPLLRKLGLALLLLVSICLFGYWASDVFAFFVQERMIALADVRWPRSTRLSVEGFPAGADGVRTQKVARGGTFELQIRADNRLPAPPPKRVEVRYWIDDGSRGRADARRIGEATPGRDDFQEYIFTFKDVFQSHTFDVIGGDDRISGLRLQVVESPEITSMVLHCEYPAYMNRAPRDLNVTGAMRIPQGTKVSLRATANKDLVWVSVLDGAGSQPDVIQIAESASDRKTFAYRLPALQSDQLLRFTLHDHDGIENQEPYRLSLSATSDEPPQVNVALRGIGSAITPEARIPIAGKVADDYGLARVWFEHTIGEDAPGETGLAASVQGATESEIAEALDARALKLEPKQKLLLAVKAADHYDLGEQVNVGSSQRFVLDVVTPDQLRSMLESRELMLRRRFETIYAELTETRDLMARVEFSSATEAEADDEAGDEAEAADEQPEGAESEAQRQLARRQVRLVRALQNVQRSAHETLAVATAFDDIYAEMVNNRIDTEDLKTRLQDTISAPLKEVGGPKMQQLTETLEKLNKQAGDEEAGPQTQRAALAQADEVLVEMKQILDRMLELESYNEVMEMLRAILNEQDELNEKTDQKRKSKLRNLLED